jgi:hypothetical protein
MRIGRSVPAGILPFVVGLHFCGQVSAAVVLDQQFALANSYAVEFDYNQQLRQRFTVGAAGLVSKFGVQLFRLNDSLDTSSDVIISIGSSSFPITPYYEARVPVSEIPVINSFADPVPWMYVDVAQGKQLAQPGNKYSIEVSQTPDSLNENATTVYWRASGTEQGYSGGELARRIPPYAPSEFWAYFGDGDGGFQTYVETAAVRRTASFTAAFDHQAQAMAGGPYTLIDGGSQIVNRALTTNDPEPLEQRGLLEFNLSSLPKDALITSAFLDFQVADFVAGSKAAGSSWVSIAGYAGDGSADPAKVALETPVLATGTIQSLGVKSFQLNISQLESILAESDQLGMITRALPSQYPSSFYTSEQAASTGLLPPTLRLEYITTEPLSGDYNFDGLVDAADYTVWRDTLGQRAFVLAADGDNSGVVDQADYTIWKTNFGNHAGSGAGADGNAAVPEPATFLMLLAGILTMCCRRNAA